MKYLNRFKKFFKDPTEIEWVKGIKGANKLKFSLTNNGIDAKENNIFSSISNPILAFEDKDLVNNSIPYKFNICHTDFVFGSRKLDSLVNSPNEVYGNFYCYKNNLETLEGGPKIVYGDFICNDNYLTSLKGMPENFKHLNCINNKITHFNDISDYSILDKMTYYNNPIYDFINLVLKLVYHRDFARDENENEEESDRVLIIKMCEAFKEYDVIKGNKIMVDNFKDALYILDLHYSKQVEQNLNRLSKTSGYEIIE